jgi:2-polyprenyl-6-methoxyphenol hydroxylase-like FAD-dependent oxidoreductase
MTRREATGRGVSVGIVGGGIGGMTAALSLLRAGFDVHVYEQASRLTEVGAGVQVSPNASRVLHRLGLAGELARTGVKPLAWHQRRWDDGRTLAGAGEDITGALRRYERLRIPRTTRLQAMSAGNKTRFHLPDGPEQQHRDAGMASGATDWSFRAAAWIYEHDASVVDPAAPAPEALKIPRGAPDP